MRANLSRWILLSWNPPWYGLRRSRLRWQYAHHHQSNECHLFSSLPRTRTHTAFFLLFSSFFYFSHFTHYSLERVEVANCVVELCTLPATVSKETAYKTDVRDRFVRGELHVCASPFQIAVQPRFHCAMPIWQWVWIIKECVAKKPPHYVREPVVVVHRVAHVDPVDLVVLVARHVLRVVILLVVVHRIHHVVHLLRYHVHRHQAVVHQLWKLVSQIRVCGIVIIRRLHIHVSILNSFVSIFFFSNGFFGCV